MWTRAVALSDVPARSREAVIAAFDREQQRLERTIVDKRADLQRAEARASHLRASLDEAYAVVQRLSLEVQQHALELDRQRNLFEQQMRDAVPSAIREFIDWVDHTRDALNAQIVRREGFGPKDVKTGYRPTIHSSNIDAVRMVATTLGDVRRRAEAMQYEHVPDLGAALDQLRQSVPTVSDAEAALLVESDIGDCA